MSIGLMICLGLLGFYGVMAALLVVRIVLNFLGSRSKGRITSYELRKAQSLSQGAQFAVRNS